MSTPPPWISALEGGHSLQLIPPKKRAARRAELAAAWGRFPLRDEVQSVGAARIARSVPVASGPRRTRRLVNDEQAQTLLWDPASPDTLFASLCDGFPPFLWVPVGRSGADFAAAMAPYLAPYTRVSALPRELRLFRGLKADVGLEDLDTFGQVLRGCEPWLDGASWGSANEDDPWTSDGQGLSNFLRLRVLMERAAEQSPGRLPSLSMRTVWSGSLLTIEEHPFGSWLFELRYNPTNHPSVNADFDQMMPYGLPRDVPVDLLASLVRGGGSAPAEVFTALDEGETTPYTCLAGAAMALGEPAGQARVRALLANPEGQEFGVELAANYNMRTALTELLAVTEDPALIERLSAMVAPLAPETP